MKWLILLLLLIVALLLWRVWRPPQHLNIGAQAPAFALPDQHGQLHTLEKYRGRWLVLYFYPRDDTPGCTKEACQFRDAYQPLNAMHAEVIGISVDDAQSHARFTAKYHLPFTLLADAQGAIAQQYGALIKLGPFKMARRISFIISPQGHIAYVFTKVNPTYHAHEVMRILKNLQNGNTV